MASIPNITLNLSGSLVKIANDGNLINQYAPFRNLLDEGELKDLTLECNLIKNSPIELTIEPAYDESVNLIFTDKNSIPRLVNSRFYLTDSEHFKIPERKGNVNTNIYTKENFEIESSLIKRVSKVITLDFQGISEGGSLPVGNYTFYFRLSDADDNMSDFISESGKVICHIGEVNNPETIRGGLANENSGKRVHFKLNNLDLAYSYIRVYYARTTGVEDSETTLAYFIEDKFKITGESTDIVITGYETHTGVSISDLNSQYAIFDSVNTMTKVQNMTFAGGITNNYEVFNVLEKLSLNIVPSIVEEATIGRLNESFKDISGSGDINNNEYYNVNNLYYRLGYWEKEIYRFGVVYVLNDYSLSPVFNIRGINSLVKDYNWGDSLPEILDKEITVSNKVHNSKGVIRIDHSLDLTKNNITPIGLKFEFKGDLNTWSPHIKGFMIVRQKRIPDIIAQGVGIKQSKKSYFPLISSTSGNIVETFLSNKLLLERKLRTISDFSVQNTALLCPEANMRNFLFQSIFNSTEYSLIPNKVKVKTATFNKVYSLMGVFENPSTNIKLSKLTYIKSGTNLISDGTNKYSSIAGDASSPWKHADPVYGEVNEVGDTISENLITKSAIKIRGIFNSFIGSSSSLDYGQYYNIYKKDYSESKVLDYFKLRYNDKSFYTPVSDRIPWNIFTGILNNVYRGDCYISTYAHRMIWGFIDPELPTNKTIVDKYTWVKNFKVKNITSKVSPDLIIPDNNNSLVGGTSISYKKILDLFTYRIKNLDSNDLDKSNWFDSSTDLSKAKILMPGDRYYEKYLSSNGLFGAEKINRPDLNAVPIGHWVVLKVCSSTNLAFRDLDFSKPSEEALHNQKRGFYPLLPADGNIRLPESDTINKGISKTMGDKYYFEVPDVPFIKTNFTNRIYHSNVLIDSVFQNGNRVFELGNYRDYSMEYGALVKLIEWYGSLIAVMEHGVLLIPINERTLISNASGENIYVQSDSVLAKNPKVLSSTFGSRWSDSVIRSNNFIYGLDTVGKKIWRTNGQNFEIISDVKIQKFLNDNIKLMETDNFNVINMSFVKTHFNAFKQDIMFTYLFNGKRWNLCWNELLGKWVTRYTWFPEFSENINNIFYTFANRSALGENSTNNYLYKHGFSGSEVVNIQPTKWYDEGTKKFEFEFVVVGVQGIQKIFDNLKIISNSTPPESFEYEITGEGFNWSELKDVLYEEIYVNATNKSKNTLNNRYLSLLTSSGYKKLPYIWIRDEELLNSYFPETSYILKDLTIREHLKTKEKLLNIYQKATDIRTGKDENNRLYGRLRGNMQYVEDSWDVQIQPINFKYAYIRGGTLAFTDNSEMKIRDKYIKIRITYDGTKYAIINAIRTMFTLSYT